MNSSATGFRESTPGDATKVFVRFEQINNVVSKTVLDEIARFGTITNYNAAAIVHEFNDPLASICFVLRGRLKAVRVDSRGEQYGMILGGANPCLCEFSYSSLRQS